jgi:orotidine-5'-phosphate decarboxylase
MREAGQKICLALDFPSGQEASEFARRFSGRVGWFKVGLELFVSEGPSVVADIARHGSVFLDLKLHDIPSTVARAAASAVGSGASMLNVHAFGGREMMARAAEAVAGEANRRGIQAPKLIAVTLLTSIGAETLADLPLRGNADEIAAGLARLARDCGLDGVVCSAGELPTIRRTCGEGFVTVVPGIRTAAEDAGDQKRVSTPRAALKAGASLLVIGRPVTQAPDPEKALGAILAEIGEMK